MIAGAIGDAWGGPWENKPLPIRFEIPAKARLSDDSQLSLATCRSITEKCSVDPEHIAGEFLQWFRASKIHGIGASTLKAMRDLDAGVHWAVAGRTGPFAAGNGAAMRIAPLAFLLDPHKPEERRLIRDVCRITHHHDEAYIGALAVLLAVQSVLRGEWSIERNFLSCVASELPDSVVRDRIEEIVRLQLTPPEIATRFGTTGYVADTVPLALRCAERITESGLLAVLEYTIALGGDTDTIASITGQLGGTALGFSALSPEFLGEIEGYEEALSIASEFADFVCTLPG